MHLKLWLLLGLLTFALAYDPVKSNNRDEAIKRRAKGNELADKKVPTKTVKEMEDSAGYHDPDYDDEEDDEEEDEEIKEKPKKKMPLRKAKSKKSGKKESVDDKSKKSKKIDKEEIQKLLNSPNVTNISAYEFLAIARENKLEKLREIINDTPTDNIEKSRQIAETTKDDDEDDENDPAEYEACNVATAGDGELCHCDMDEINCSAIVMDSDNPHLQTMDVRIMQKDFKPIIANFSENAISKLQKDKVLPGFEKYVSRLDVTNNQIRYIDSDVFKPFTNLSRIDFSHNSLQTIKKPVFDAVKTTLHHLDLSYNRIKSLTDNVFENLSELKWLSLDGNPIKVWKKEYFKGLTNLQELSLDNCNIDDLPADIFEYLPNLKVLSLRSNPMEEIPAVVSKTKSLKHIDMSVTNIAEIRDHAFAGDSDLEGIILQEMPFLSVIRDCGFCGLPKLKSLLLNDNSKLVEIHPNAFGFIKSDPGHKAADIAEIDIHKSNISIISEHMMDYDKLDTFKIGENPWKCDCNTMFLMEDKFGFKSDSVQPICSSPPKLKDRHLVTLRASEACEDARFLGRSGRFSSVLGIGLLVAFLAVGFFYCHSSGKLYTLIRKVRKEPEVSYSNLQNSGEDFALESDFQPRPAEV